jgi:hypothetical protein
MFELTMLGAILATVLALLITAELPAPRPRVYDPEVSNGKIMVAVEEPQDSAYVERTLLDHGLDEVRIQES